jgi:hypothetical protein
MRNSAPAEIGPVGNQKDELTNAELNLIAAARLNGLAIDGKTEKRRTCYLSIEIVWKLTTRNGTVFESSSFDRFCKAVEYMESVPLGALFQPEPKERYMAERETGKPDYYAPRAALPQKQRRAG